MKLITYEYKKKREIGVLSKKESQVYPLNKLGFSYEDMNDLIEKITYEDKKNIEKAIKDESVKSLSISSINIMAPIIYPKQDIILDECRIEN